MHMKQSLYHVTTNPGKFAEVSTYLAHRIPDIELVQLSVDIPEIQTLDQRAIAVDKARKAWDIVQKPLILDDAAMYFEKYHQFPGTLSKFVSQGIGFEGLKRLIDEGDRGYFLLYIVYMDGPDSIHIFEGRCEGRLRKPDHFYGDPNLPYDVLFVPDGSELSYADMRTDLVRYAPFFYRLRALDAFLTWYNHR